MALPSGIPTVADIIGILQNLQADDLPIRVSTYEGDHSITVHTVRKHVVTDEEGNIVDAYVVING